MAKVRRVSQLDWKRYKQVVNDFIDQDSGKQPFLWLRRFNQILSFGEDVGARYEPVSLEGLFHYNYIKTWGTQGLSVSGELDATDVVLYISKKLLEEHGYINQYGYWNFDWAEDRFILNGKVYKPFGDTQAAQANDEPLLFFVILKRANKEESERILKTYIADETPTIDPEGETDTFDNKTTVENLLKRWSPINYRCFGRIIPVTASPSTSKG